jgi:hypothetical protein
MVLLRDLEINFSCSSLHIIPSEAYILILFISAILWCHENERQTNSALLRLVKVMILLVCESHPVSFWKEFGNCIYMFTIHLGVWVWVSAIQFAFKKCCISASHKQAWSLTPISSVDTRSSMNILSREPSKLGEVSLLLMDEISMLSIIFWNKLVTTGKVLLLGCGFPHV